MGSITNPLRSPATRGDLMTHEMAAQTADESEAVKRAWRTVGFIGEEAVGFIWQDEYEKARKYADVNQEKAKSWELY